jgi:hypothetical protein
MAKTLYVADKNVKQFTPVYNAPGKWTHGIEKLSKTEYYAERRNRKKYGYAAHGQSFPDQAAALAWCQNDYNNVLKPSGIASTTTTADFIVPAVGASVVIAVASATGLVAPQSLNIGGGAGSYTIASVAGLNVTAVNTGKAGNKAPGGTVTSGAGVTVVPK